MEFLVLKGFGCLRDFFDRGWDFNVFFSDISYVFGGKLYSCFFMWKIEILVFVWLFYEIVINKRDVIYGKFDYCV